VQFEVDCDLYQYENEVEITKGIHSLNLMDENNPMDIQKSSQNDRLSTYGACDYGIMGKGILMNW